MRSILIVDDEPFIVQGILSAMPWEDLEIGPAYSANSMQQAVAVFEKHPVDILLCDIEMPQGSGLELLAWIKDHSPQTVSLLLTSHADFEYAQQALKLGCSDYLLKPIPYEKLEKILHDIVRQVDQKRQKDEYSRKGQLWEKNETIVETKFWTDLVLGGLPVDGPSIAQIAERSQVAITPGDMYLPILISMKKMNLALSDWKDEIIAYSIGNLAAETILAENSQIPILKLSNLTYLAILKRDSMFGDDKAQIETKCHDLVRNYQRYLDSQFACYLGDWSDVRGLPAMVASLQGLDRQNVAYLTDVMSLAKPAWRSEPPSILNTLHWADLLQMGNTAQIFQEATHYLDEQTAKRQMNADVLRKFYLNFNQVIYSVLAQKGVQVHQLFPNAMDDLDHDTTTLDQLKIKLRSVLSAAETSLNLAVHAKSLVEQVKDYIQQHLEQDLTCEELGNHFYLHADHLTRVLKKETGQSLSELIVKERIKAAQMLLSHSSLQISQIAVQVGYTNVSHFTRMFKRLTGENPVEWRKHAAERKI
jgi:two-component system response regulator YesN